MRSTKLASQGAGLVCVCCLTFSAVGSQPVTNRLALRAGAEPTNALAGLQLQKGFRIEVVAAEPMVSAPVAIAFDENNRLYVAELRENVLGLEERTTQGRIRLLEGLDGKGRFGTSTVFAEDLAQPSALACYRGGVFVASGREVLYLKDVDGDGIADLRKVVMTGFGGTNVPSSGGLLNNFNWGLDNRIYGATAGIGGAVSVQQSEADVVPIDGADFSFDPRTFAVAAEFGPSGSGLAFDNMGRRFACDPNRPLRMEIMEWHYRARNPSFVTAPPFVDVIGPASAVYLAKSAESEEGNTNKMAWLTSARGLAIYRGDLFPTNYAGNAFICDPEAHVVHRVVPREQGFGVSGARAADEPNSEFLSASRSNFRPVQAINGPEGGLYIVDSANGDLGRIYRVVPEEFKQGEPEKLRSASVLELATALASTNGWRRDTASRLLFERQDAAAQPLVSNLVVSAKLPAVRIQALQALAGNGWLTEGQVLTALQDRDAQVRVHALKVSHRLANGGSTSQALRNQIRRLAADGSTQVRYQLALTAGSLPGGDKLAVLTQLSARDLSNPWMESAIMSSLGDGAGNLFAGLASNAAFRTSPAGLAFLQRLATMIGVKGRADEVGQVLEVVRRANLEPVPAYSLVRAVGEGLHQTGSGLALVDPDRMLRGMYETALAAAMEVTFAEGLRAEAVRLLGVSPYAYSDTSDWLLLLTNPGPQPTLRLAAISTLTRYDDPRLLPALVERWAGFPLEMRRLAASGLVVRANRGGAVLSAIERGAIPPIDLFSPTLNLLRTHPDPEVSQRAQKVLGPVPFRRPAAFEQYKAALGVVGAPRRGRDVFSQRCVECHQVRSSANRAMGPELSGARLNGRERLLRAIVEPNLEVLPLHRTWVLETKQGELVAGVKTDETPQSVTILQAGLHATVWPRLNIKAMRVEPWSSMPDGLEAGLSAQSMADLLAYLMNPQE